MKLDYKYLDRKRRPVGHIPNGAGFFLFAGFLIFAIALVQSI